jgi:hypothetical protein
MLLHAARARRNAQPDWRAMKERWYLDKGSKTGQWGWFFDFKKPIPLIGEIWDDYMAKQVHVERPHDTRSG